MVRFMTLVCTMASKQMRKQGRQRRMRRTNRRRRRPRRAGVMTQDGGFLPFLPLFELVGQALGL